MKLTFGTVLALASMDSAFAHGSHRKVARQASSISRIFTGAPYPTGPGFDVPPLAEITQSSTPEPTVPLPATFPPGSTPLPLGSGAPGLPDLSSFDPSIYPPLDKIPPINSPEVRAWLSEIAGANIPNYPPTKDGTCASDPEAAAQAGADGRCWWTCTGCTRDTDVVGCGDKERWGLTFDDGPSDYTPKLLTYLQSIDTQATFYEVGSRVISHPETVQTQLMLGHELSVHTWSHTSMTTLTNEQVVAELGWTRKAIKDVTGVTPLTFRPPFGDMDDRIRAIANAMNLTPVIWSNVGAGKADTEDFEVPSGALTAPETVNQFRNTLAIVEGTFDTGIITLEHDLFQETVDLAIGSTLPDALTRPGPEQRGWKLGTVAQCRGQRSGDAYQETTTNQTILARLGRAPTEVSTSITSAISVSETTVPTSPVSSVPSSGSETTTTSSVVSNGPSVVSSGLTAAPAYSTTATQINEVTVSSSIIPAGTVPATYGAYTPPQPGAGVSHGQTDNSVIPAAPVAIPDQAVAAPEQAVVSPDQAVVSPDQAVVPPEQASTNTGGEVYPIETLPAPAVSGSPLLGAAASGSTPRPSATSDTSGTNSLTYGINGATSNHHAGRTVYGISCIFALAAILF